MSVCVLALCGYRCKCSTCIRTAVMHLCVLFVIAMLDIVDLAYKKNVLKNCSQCIC